MKIFFAKGAADLDLDPGTFERTLHHSEIGQRCSDLAVSLQSHVRLKRKKQPLDFDLMFSRKYDFWIQGIRLHVA